jgi:hypothetical protein
MSTQINTKQKLNFIRSAQFDLDYWKPTDDGFSTNTGAQYEQIESHYRELEETKKNVVAKDPEVLQFTKHYQEVEGEEDMKIPTTMERGRRDNVALLFQSPKFQMDKSSTSSAYIKHKTSLPDKKYNIKRDNDTMYFEALVKNKHTMRA